MGHFFQSFYECIIAGQSYITILKGVGVTVLITFFGLLLGTALAALLCLMSRTKSRIARGVEKVYTIVVRGTPVLMLLLLLFYVVFARSDLSAVVIAVIAFGLNSAAHIDEIMKTALSSVPEGQVKAARTLGFTKFQAFRYVVYPQALAFARPVYQNAVINILQWTSVVGYITIADLTRVINNIGARTAKPFFAIFMGIAFYLLLGYAVHLIFWLTERRKRGERHD